MTTASLDHLALDIVLPWHEDQQQQDRFQRLIKFIAIPMLLFLLVMPMLPDLTPEAEVQKKVVTKLALDLPTVKPIEQPQDKPEQQKPLPKKSKAKTKKKPDQKTAPSSLSALSQQLSALRKTTSGKKIQKKNVFVAKSGKVQKSSRSLLGQKNAINGSSGLASGDVTVNGQSSQALEHESGAVDSDVLAVDLPSEEEYYAEPQKKSRRDMQSIRRTLERYKGAVYALYTKELRNTPELNGRFIFEFVILADGKIAQLKLVSSELKAPTLEQQMLAKINTIEFGKTENKPTAVQYTFTFLPS